MNSAGKLLQQFMTHRDGNRGFADATRPHDGDETLDRQQVRYFLNGPVSPHHSGQAGRQVAGLIGMVAAPWKAPAHSRGDRRDEAISLPRQRGHISGAGLAVAQRLAKRSDMDSQAALIDRDPGPDPRHQVVLADDLAGLLDQHDENVERASAERKRPPRPLDKPLRHMQPERTEQDDFIRRYRGACHLHADCVPKVRPTWSGPRKIKLALCAAKPVAGKNISVFTGGSVARVYLGRLGRRTVRRARIVADTSLTSARP